MWRSEECGDLWSVEICGVWRSVELRSEECGDLRSVEICGVWRSEECEDLCGE